MEVAVPVDVLHTQIKQGHDKAGQSLRGRLDPLFMAGLASAAIIVLALAGAGWWAVRTELRNHQQERQAALQATADLLSPSVELLIQQGQLAQLRAMLSGVAQAQRFAAIRVTLPEPAAELVADSGPVEPGKYPVLPDTWLQRSSPSSAFSIGNTPDGRLRATMPLRIADRGQALLEIDDAFAPTAASQWQAQAALLVVGMAGLFGLWMFARQMATKYRSLRAIQSALNAIMDGERSTEALLVSPALGEDAAGFNRLLHEHEQFRIAALHDRAEQTLGNRRGRDGDLMSICDAMWQGLVLVDDQMRIKFANGAAAAYLRTKREDMIGQLVQPLLADAKTMEALNSIATGATRGKAVVELSRGPTGVPGDTTPSGATQTSSVLRFSMRPVRKEDNAAAIMVIEDVTQQRVADESRNAFVASATHELRTPLTNIRLYVDSLLEDPLQDATKRTQAMNVVSQEVRRLERMVGDMLSVAQIESGTLRLNKGEVRLDGVFEELQRDFAEQARSKEIKIGFDLPPKWPSVEGDRDKIVMALHNLVGNAIKYTPAGGDVIVRAAMRDGQFNVDVIDNGIGIKEDEQSLVFERFYRAKDRRIAHVTGTGLGLSIAREVVRLHGGDITLHSQIDRGSTFSMTLPALAA